MLKQTLISAFLVYFDIDGTNTSQKSWKMAMFSITQQPHCTMQIIAFHFHLSAHHFNWKQGRKTTRHKGKEDVKMKKNPHKMTKHSGQA